MGTHACLGGVETRGEGGVFELDELEEVVVCLCRAPWDPSALSVGAGVSMEYTNRLAWLSIPFPPRMGMTEVDAVLNDTTMPSEVNGVGGDGKLLW